MTTEDVRREQFKGVIWPRPAMKGPEGKLYRYVVVGVLVTDQPLDLHNKNEVVVDGPAAGMAQVIEALPGRKAASKLGDASQVLCSLNDI